jgi:D-arabinose 1-dehydrogenase-like Zn-dependent alcohol dehydrogenase
MKVAVLYEAGKPFKIEDVELPTVSDDDILIRVAVCGVCHTDLKVAEERSPFVSPTILGHEVSGTIERVGRGQHSFFKEGDRVIVGMRYKCDRCRYCLAGRDNLCNNPPKPPSYKKANGSPVHRWNVGGFAEYIAVPGHMVFPVPEGLPLEEAGVIGCRVTTAYNAVKHRAKLGPGESALVIGCGGISLNTIQFLRCFGAYPIIAVDIIDEKLKAAEQFGATHTINAGGEDPAEEIKKMTDGGVDKAFEAIGNPKTADQIIRSTRPGGTAVIIGGLGRMSFTISDGRFGMSEITITGVSSRQANDVTEVLQMVQDKRIEVKSLISKRYPYRDINQSFDDLEHGRVLVGVSMWT